MFPLSNTTQYGLRIFSRCQNIIKIIAWGIRSTNNIVEQNWKKRNRAKHDKTLTLNRSILFLLWGWSTKCKEVRKSLRFVWSGVFSELSLLTSWEKTLQNRLYQCLFAKSKFYNNLCQTGWKHRFWIPSWLFIKNSFYTKESVVS